MKLNAEKWKFFFTEHESYITFTEIIYLVTKKIHER